MHSGLRQRTTCRYQMLKNATDRVAGEPIVQSCGESAHHQPLPTTTFEAGAFWAAGADSDDSREIESCGRTSARRRALKLSIRRVHCHSGHGLRKPLG